MEPKIKECLIIEDGWKNIVRAIFDNGSGCTIGIYYPDELSYDESDFIGLTKKQAKDFMAMRDTDYLRN